MQSPSPPPQRTAPHLRILVKPLRCIASSGRLSLSAEPPSPAVRVLLYSALYERVHTGHVMRFCWVEGVTIGQVQPNWICAAHLWLHSLGLRAVGEIASV